MVQPETLKEINYFKKLTTPELASIARYFEEIFINENHTIYHEEDESNYLYFIKKGHVELTLLLPEKTEQVAFLSGGESFGIGELFFDNYYLNAVATENSALLRIKKNLFFKYIITIPQVNFQILNDFANLIKIFTTWHKWYSAINSMILYLVSISTKEKIVNNRFYLNKEITQEYISKKLNLTREYVSRIFKKLKEKQIMEKDGNKIRINKEILDRELKKNDVEMLNILKSYFI